MTCTPDTPEPSECGGTIQNTVSVDQAKQWQSMGSERPTELLELLQALDGRVGQVEAITVAQQVAMDARVEVLEEEVPSTPPKPTAYVDTMANQTARRHEELRKLVRGVGDSQVTAAMNVIDQYMKLGITLRYCPGTSPGP